MERGASLASIKQHVPKSVNPDTLSFDPLNPRLAELTNASQLDDRGVIEYLRDEADLGELVQAIAADGYRDFEPLITCKERKKTIVLEGNRRLAALRVLRNKDLAAELGVRVPPMSAVVRQTLNSVSTIEVDNRSEARAYIGFKHVNGPHRWDSYAKARFAQSWYKEARSAGLGLGDIATRMGDTNDTIPRMVSALYVLDQAIGADQFQIEDRKQRGPFGFSHLYTALTYPSVRTFLGITGPWRMDQPEEKPIPKSHLDELGLLLTWLYGSKRLDLTPVIRTQNPDVKRLADVLENPSAVVVLRENHDLGTAYDRLDRGRNRFSSHVVSAAQSLENALLSVGGYDGSEELFAIVQQAQEHIVSLVGLMTQRRDGTKRDGSKRSGSRSRHA